LVTGETGTGKELIARFIHEQSARAHGPFVAVNCAALPPALVESELFGHVAGAFTGALADHPGQFRLANGGTLFLDELGELPLEVQAKLLRVLEEREVRPLGGESTLPIDIRVVTATHRDLKEEIAAGRFREDLYYRLGVLRLAVPALRDRASDVRLLAESFLATIAPDGGRRFSDEAIARLEAYAWPGNVRELRNVVERLAILSTGEVIDASDLPPDLGAPSPKAMDGGDVITLKEAERRAIVAAWKATGGKKGETAERLGISWPTLNKKMKEYGIA
ncbi:MAG: sigma-54 dependent transcriptional regulator, partial [Planctomycetota bacterium]